MKQVLNAEHERLSGRWSKLEAKLTREHGFQNLTRRQRRNLLEARELLDLDERIDDVVCELQSVLKSLPTVDATNALGLASKLAVAGLVVHREENEQGHFLIASILRDLKKMFPEGA
jgi:hypothetical protein